ncbi:unnamed protein product [Phaedon cochleariae]|uniref:Spaetzle domain-containing protein n=1 Tax=Phaedon cochleariae TaxID=80249 RepID=A0A9P0DZ61_PHACE|nr:unnamed protein product [Phaedon cochleariae]
MCKIIGVVLLLCFFELVTVFNCKPVLLEVDPLEQNVTAGNNTRNRRLSDIIFPDDEVEAPAPLRLPLIRGRPACASGATFCEHFDRYPSHQLKHILSRHSLGKELFGMDESPDEVAGRDGSGESFVCGSVDNTIFPKIGVNKNNKWKFIINQEEDGYVQGVRIELCRSFGKPCDVIGELPEGYVTSCKQKYIYRRLLSLTDNGTPVQDTFKLPSACCCTYKRSFTFMTNFGRRMSKR